VLHKSNSPSLTKRDDAICESLVPSSLSSASTSSASTSASTSSTSASKPSATDNFVGKQCRIMQFTSRPISVARSKQLDYQLIKLIASDYLPFSLVENEHFKEFVKMLNPSYILPSRKTASQSLLDQVYTRLVEAVKGEIATATAVTVTTNIGQR
jgi:hypothetical protein